MTLPQPLFPAALTYEQELATGRAAIKNYSFQSNIGKFVLQLVDYPISDQRSAANRMEAGIDQMSRNPSLIIESVEDISNDIVSGIFIESWDRDLKQVHAIFVDGQREYHLSSESYDASNLDLVLEQSEIIIRSFGLATANALYYQLYESRKIYSSLAKGLNADYVQETAALLSLNAAESIENCYQLRGRTPAELILIIDNNGMVENTFSSPRSAFGRCLELAYIGLTIDAPPISEMHILIGEHLQ